MRELIVGFVIGAGAGGGLTYLLYKRYLTRKLNEELNTKLSEEYEKMRAEFEQRDVELAEAEAERAAALVNDDAAKYDHKTLNVLNAYRGVGVDAGREEDPAESEHPEEDDMDETERLIEESEAEERIQKALEESRPKCKILKPEHFGEIPNYECETLKFYVHDHMLVHENGELVEDVEFLLDDALDRYGWADNDEDEDPLYVRNYGLQRDYDVQKEFDEWHGAD